MKTLDSAIALVVLSGGQDSTTCLFWAKEQFKEVHAVTFDYGQRHAAEIDSAKIVSAMAGVKSHEIIDVKDILRSTSPLTSDAELEKYENHEQMESVIGNRVELTFVPMRNTLFLTIAANRAVDLGACSIVTGVCGEDNANYPDCTAEFILKVQHAFNESLGLLRNDHPALLIETPLMYMTKAESVRLAQTLPGCMEALAYSHTSYDGKYPPTDMNHANVLRAHGFEQAGVADPLVVRAVHEGLMEFPATANYAEARAKAARDAL